MGHNLYQPSCFCSAIRGCKWCWTWKQWFYCRRSLTDFVRGEGCREGKLHSCHVPVWKPDVGVGHTDLDWGKNRDKELIETSSQQWSGYWRDEGLHVHRTKSDVDARIILRQGYTVHNYMYRCQTNWQEEHLHIVVGKLPDLEIGDKLELRILLNYHHWNLLSLWLAWTLDKFTIPEVQRRIISVQASTFAQLQDVTQVVPQCLILPIQWLTNSLAFACSWAPFWCQTDFDFCRSHEQSPQKLH